MSTKADVNNVYQNFQNARNKLNNTVIQQQENKFKMVMESQDEKRLWSEINWSGKYKERSEGNIPVQVMAEYFEKLYEPLDCREQFEMDNLTTDLYIPVTDDPITEAEMESSKK